MALQKQTYINDETVITAEQLNAIQDAIIENEKTIADLSAESGSDSSNVVIVTSDMATGKASMTASEIITEINAGKVVLLYVEGMYITLSAPAGVPPVNGIATMYDAETRLITHGNIYVLDDGTISPDTAKMTTSVPKTGETGNVLTYGESGPVWSNIDTGSSGDSGSGIYVGSDEPTDENVSIWINPEGEPDTEVVVTESEVNAIIEEKLGVIENGTY